MEGGQEPWRTGGQEGAKEVGDKKAGSRILKVVGTRKMKKKIATLCNIFEIKIKNIRKRKEGWELRVKGIGSGRLRPL